LAFEDSISLKFFFVVFVFDARQLGLTREGTLTNKKRGFKCRKKGERGVRRGVEKKTVEEEKV